MIHKIKRIKSNIEQRSKYNEPKQEKSREQRT